MANKPSYEELSHKVEDLLAEIADLKNTIALHKSDKFTLESLVDGLSRADIGVDIVDTNYNIHFQNQILKERFGDLSQQLCYEKYMGLDEPCSFCPMVKAINTDQVLKTELVGTDGKYYELLSVPLQGRGGAIDRALEIVKDITDSKKTIQALSENEENYRRLFNSCGDGILIADLTNMAFIKSNPAICKMLAYTMEELLTKTVKDLHPPESLDYVVGEFKAQAEGKKLVANNIPCLTKQGAVVYADISTIKATIKGRECNVGFFRNITERKLAEEALNEINDKFLHLASNVPAYLAYVNADTLTYEFVNNMFEKSFGIPQKKIIGSHIKDIIGEANYQFALPYINDAKSGNSVSYENSFDLVLGKRWVQVNYTPITDPNGHVASIVVLTYDITDLKKAEEALKDSEKKYRQIYDNLLDAYYEASIDGIILEISPSIENFSKYKQEELIGKSLYQLYTNPDERDGLVEMIIKDGRVSEYELHLTDKDGARLLCSINTMLVKDDKGEPHKLVGVVRDISERKRVEKEKKELKERLVRSQKMESLGLLAGGVAHDLNNVLSGIVSYPDLLLMDLPEDSPLRKPILTIQKSGQKAADIVQDLLTLARRGVSITEVLSLNEMILDYLKSPEYHQLLNYNPALSVETNLENALLNIKGSPIHLKKAIMNLVSNAAEAQSSCGKIVISTYNKYIDMPIKEYEEIREGDYAVLEVADNGTGIADEDLSRIFEPFYSKKVMGRSGTGLGMAVVWGSVQDHNGYINVESTVGEGTTFYLYFPVIREKLLKEKDLISIKDYMGNNESILVVDDIKEQREIATNLLSRLNYSVSAVSSGEAALEYLKTNTADLLLLDMIMDPGLDGLDTFKKIIADHPHQKALIASGFSETDRVKEAQKIGVGQYIKKPYTLEKIGIAVKKELKNELVS
jgi:PAS domain S-box-containing protein